MRMFVVPVKTVSEANSHAHWRARSTRAKSHRHAAYVAMHDALGASREAMRLTRTIEIVLTRVAPSSGLDSDNLPTSLKHVRDGLADWLGIDDRDPRVTWRYRQERGPYCVRVEMSA